jgi:hypothetical protein
VGLKDRWKADQLRWAAERGSSHDTKGYVESLSLNLFQPMSPATEAEFSRGSGGELRANRRANQPKMHALHSSSVLACNVFDYWRTKDVGLVGEILGVESRIDRLTFEAQFPTGLPGNPPNIDVALWLVSGHVWGIESKFTEPFGAPKTGPAFKDKYFPDGPPVWSDRGLARCASFAIALRDGAIRFRHLDAAQLLKHALGLHANHQGRFTLCYLYVDQETPDGKQHRNEITQFHAAVDGDFPFVPLSYSTFLKGLRGLASRDHDAYFTYLETRYQFATGE